MATKIVVVLLGGALSAVAVTIPALTYAQFETESYRQENYPIRIVLPLAAIRAQPSTPDSLAAPVEGEAPAEAPALLETTGDDRGAHLPSLRSLNDKSTRAQRLLADIDFDLARVSRPNQTVARGESIEVRKPVRLDGTDQGDARIFVLSDSVLAVDREELSRLLARAGKPRLGQRDSEAAGEIITFDDLRKLGIGIRYDPTGDRIIVST